ncbi:hypothetical protein FA95DRAFT_1609021 [Auriscalpium vulgare]|uniref:Uncharacterized protein n=1 Tax=Auriscalpium vulgare TaxID=40419 RepID=A0ACB8RHX1_9AGAM|nr:hypothetical protein FA95DRAFT_1609021 [Auriscalpium vulgare]
MPRAKPAALRPPRRSARLAQHRIASGDLKPRPTAAKRCETAKRHATAAKRRQTKKPPTVAKRLPTTAKPAAKPATKPTAIPRVLVAEDYADWEPVLVDAPFAADEPTSEEVEAFNGLLLCDLEDEVMFGDPSRFGPARLFVLDPDRGMLRIEDYGWHSGPGLPPTMTVSTSDTASLETAESYSCLSLSTPTSIMTASTSDTASHSPFTLDSPDAYPCDAYPCDAAVLSSPFNLNSPPASPPCDDDSVFRPAQARHRDGRRKSIASPFGMTPSPPCSVHSPRLRPEDRPLELARTRKSIG